MPRFQLGAIYITPGAEQALRTSHQSVNTFLDRHQAGDWGELSEEDCQTNGDGSGTCISAYRTMRDEEVWVITDHDHRATTILLPSEY
jgi:hypothetical protein